MKTKRILRTLGLLIMITSLFVLSSCTKQADGDLTKDQKEQQGKDLETTSIDEADITESDEDLTTVDYKEFYDQLAPHGEWIQVQTDEIGLAPKTASSNSSNNNSLLLSNMLGIQNVYAASSESAGLTYVWKPSTDLAVVSAAGEAPVYVPYSNGQWVNTDAGWYFKAPTPEEEVVHHYGRWVNTASDGWLWVPGRVWAPAWVDWKQNDNYVAWAPVPPSVYIVDNTIKVPPIDEDRYVIVEKKYFVQPQLYKYMYKENKNKIMIKEMTKTDGIMIINHTIINKGPEVSNIEKYWGKKIEVVNVNRVKIKNDMKYSDKEYYVYTPMFTKVKHSKKVNTPMFHPQSYKKYEERKEMKSKEKEYKKEEKEYKKEEKEYKKEEKEYKKEEKEIKKENNGNNKGNKNNGNVKENKGNRNSNKDNGNVKENKGSNNNNKDNGSVKENKGSNNRKGKK